MTVTWWPSCWRKYAEVMPSRPAPRTMVRMVGFQALWGAALGGHALAAMESIADSIADSGAPLPSCRSPCPWYLRDSPPRRHGAAVCSFGAPRHCGALRGGSPDGFEKCGSTGNLSVHGSLRLRWGGVCCCRCRCCRHPLSCRGRLYGAGAAAVHCAGTLWRRTGAREHCTCRPSGFSAAAAFCA